MADPGTITKARLQAIDNVDGIPKVINEDKATNVQFNPESLKVSFANEIQKPTGGTDQNGTAPAQFVGAGSTKLAVQLWFDVTQELGQQLPDTTDVRDLTTRIAYFMTPSGPSPMKPPAVRFSWGTFQFDGLMESMEETLELFSSDGRPLRASVGIVITQQKIVQFNQNASGKKGAGQTQQQEALAGSSVQSMASNGAAKGRNWQSVAAANGIENPRMLQAGQFIDLQATKSQIVNE